MVNYLPSARSYGPYKIDSLFSKIWFYSFLGGNRVAITADNDIVDIDEIFTVEEQIALESKLQIIDKWNALKGVYYLP